MELLKNKIIAEADIIEPNIVKVDGFLNHQIDTILYQEIGKEFARRFKDKKITKIVTIEASGIALALTTAMHLNNIPVVFAKKGMSATVNENLYVAKVHSFTKNITYNAIISKKYLSKEDHILLIDDFLANGQAMLGLIDICNQANATVEGVGIVVEKGFQDGRKVIEETGVEVKSLAIIKAVEGKNIIFK